jgi:hypothetical protein
MSEKSVAQDIPSPHLKEHRSSLWFPVILAILAVIATVLVISWNRVMNGQGLLEVRARTEISQLETAVETFRLRYKVFPPSKIKLSETGNYDLNDPLDKLSVRALGKIWPSINFKQGIDWNGDGKVDAPDAGHVLEGDQCLVFFLGGIPGRVDGAPVPLGFAGGDNPARKDGNRHPPFLEFRSDRLFLRDGSSFFSYRDPWGTQPYAYFSSHNRPNSYNPLGDSDCASLGVWPYARRLAPFPEYHKPNSFQIICAGPDQRFGPGTVIPGGQVWTPENAHQIPEAGRDDLASFHSTFLGRND